MCIPKISSSNVDSPLKLDGHELRIYLCPSTVTHDRVTPTWYCRGILQFIINSNTPVSNSLIPATIYTRLQHPQSIINPSIKALCYHSPLNIQNPIAFIKLLCLFPPQIHFLDHHFTQLQKITPSVHRLRRHRVSNSVDQILLLHTPPPPPPLSVLTWLHQHYLCTRFWGFRWLPPATKSRRRIGDWRGRVILTWPPSTGEIRRRPNSWRFMRLTPHYRIPTSALFMTVIFSA